MAKPGALLSSESIPFAGDVTTAWEIVKGSGKALNHFAKGEVGKGVQRLAIAGGRVALETADLGGVGEMIRPAAVAVLRAADQHLDKQAQTPKLVRSGSYAGTSHAAGSREFSRAA